MPYDYLTIDESKLNLGLVSASYFTPELQELYQQEFVNEKGFFGDNDDDLVEFSLYLMD